VHAVPVIVLDRLARTLALQLLHVHTHSLSARLLQLAAYQLHRARDAPDDATYRANAVQLAAGKKLWRLAYAPRTRTLTVALCDATGATATTIAAAAPLKAAGERRERRFDEEDDDALAAAISTLAHDSDDNADDADVTSDCFRFRQDPIRQIFLLLGSQDCCNDRHDQF
jgi:hypothetical protein